MRRIMQKFSVWVVIMAVIAVMAVAFVYNGKVQFAFPANQSRTALSLWVAEEDGSTPVYFPYSPEKNKIVKMSAMLPEVSDETVLQVVCNYKEVSASVDGEIIYRSTPAKIGNIETVIGNYKAFIPLRAEHSGGELLLEVEPRESIYVVAVKDVSLNTMSGHLVNTVNDNLITIIIGTILILLGCASLIVWLCCRLSGISVATAHFNNLVYITLFSIISGIWILSYVHLLGIMAGKTVLSGAINYISFMLMPYMASCLIRSANSNTERLLNRLQHTAAAVVVVQIGLFLAGIFDLPDMLIVSHIMCIAVICVVSFIFAKSAGAVSVNMKRRTVIWFAAIATLVTIAIIMYIVDKDWMICVCTAMCVFIAMMFSESIIGLFEIAKEKIKTEEFRRYAFTDALTELGSRYSYEMAIEKYKRCSLSEDFTVVVMDLNHLKVTNDKYGHAAGDEIIKGAADCIMSAFKNFGTYYRTGGDEFVVFIEADVNTLKEIFASFEACVNEWQGRIVNELSVSYGWASVRDCADCLFEDMVKTADNMMYENKRKYYEKINYQR